MDNGFHSSRFVLLMIAAESSSEGTSKQFPDPQFRKRETRAGKGGKKAFEERLVDGRNYLTEFILLMMAHENSSGKESTIPHVESS